MSIDTYILMPIINLSSRAMLPSSIKLRVKSEYRGYWILSAWLMEYSVFYDSVLLAPGTFIVLDLLNILVVDSFISSSQGRAFL